MDTPDREHKSLPHALKEVPATAERRAQWRICIVDERVGGELDCPLGSSIAEAYTLADAHIATNFPGYTL